MTEGVFLEEIDEPSGLFSWNIKVGIIHASIGRVSFAPEKIAENSQELINAILKAKPSSAKGTYVRGISMASSMSPGISIDTKGFVH